MQDSKASLLARNLSKFHEDENGKKINKGSKGSPQLAARQGRQLHSLLMK